MQLGPRMRRMLENVDAGRSIHDGERHDAHSAERHLYFLGLVRRVHEGHSLTDDGRRALETGRYEEL